MSVANPQPPVRQGLQTTGQNADVRLRLHEDRLRLGERLLQQERPRSCFIGPVPQQARLVHSAAGRIEHLLFTVPPNRDATTGEPFGELVNERDALHFRTLIWALGANRRYTVVCGLEQEQIVRGWFAENQVPESHYQLVFSHYNYTIWAQDGYTALNDDQGQPILCEGIRFNRFDDMVLADEITTQTNDVEHVHSILEFQGGNILGTPQQHLVGMDYIHGNLGRVGLENEARVVKKFEELFGGKVQPIGLDHELPDSEKRGGLEGHRQPIFHIDMYVTVTGVEKDGKEVVAVASPRLARQVLGQPERPADQDFYFDQAATQLAQWYHVERMPLLPIWGRLFDWEDAYYSLTWNNVVLENFMTPQGPQRHVYMPTYEECEHTSRELGVDPGPRRDLDKEAERIWSEVLGFNVTRLNSMEDLAYARGVIHCITKVLKRSSAIQSKADP